MGTTLVMGAQTDFLEVVVSISTLCAKQHIDNHGEIGIRLARQFVEKQLRSHHIHVDTSDGGFGSAK
jgi:hypothetical protein